MRKGSSTSQSLSHLSEREKLQYVQLSKTRERIIDEFSRTTGKNLLGTSIASNTNSKPRDAKTSESKTRSKVSSNGEILPPIRSGIMMLPILSTSGDIAMGGNSSGKRLKLPIFKLPYIDSKQFQSEKTKLPSISQSDSPSVRHSFVSYFDKKSFKKAMVSCIRLLSPSEKKYISGYIGATEHDVGDIFIELEKRVEFDNDQTFVNGRKCIFVSTDLFRPEFYSPSVFMVASSPMSSQQTKSINKGQLQSTANLDFTMLGMSPEFHNYIVVSSKLSDQKSVYSKNGIKYNGKANRINNNVGHRRSNSASMDSVQLTKMLINSMSKMDKHANLIRKGMEEAQEIVDSKDSNVKVVIFTVGAERMQVALFKFVRLELKRGLTAWKMFIQIEKRQIVVNRFFHFMVVRNLVVGISRLVGHVLKTNLLLWKKHADAESHRLLRERIERSATLIQSIIRSRISYKKVHAIKMRRKYQKLYDSTIKIQALIRGTVVKLRYQRSRVDRIQRNAATVIQTAIRGALSRSRVQLLLIQYKRAMASRVIQRYIRGILSRRRVKELKLLRQMEKCAVFIQKIIRGFVDRRTMTAKRISRMRYKYAVRIQALARGFVTRTNMEKKLAELQVHRNIRVRAATQIQAAYRGFHARLLFKMKLYQLRKVKAEQFKAATAIITMVRGFLCRAELRSLKAARLEKWISDAREWQEMWSDESSTWFYLNIITGDALWEPNREGYTKFDGTLVLASGEIITDPRYVTQQVLDDGSVDGQEAETGPKNAKNNKLCSECVDRIAIRSCNECGDKFCTKCYKSTHGTGSRRTHTYANIGPIDCAECELLLAGRWCVSCDEAYCNSCWKKVHSHGKRRFHPYSEVSTNGRIDSRIFTMDGEQLDSYDTSYNQQRSELEKSTATAFTQLLEYSADGNSSTEEWTEYADDAGYPYWYNNHTGESSYERPTSLLEY